MHTVTQENENIYQDFFKNTETLWESFFDGLSSQYQQTNDIIQDVQKRLNDMQIHEFDHHFKQLAIGLNPKYYPFTNKEVVKKTFETNGENLIEGMKQLTENLEKGLLPALTCLKTFKIGENIATSEGDVVYKNNLMELIHYTPVKKNVHEEPLLIIPPWINKYYIFDLTKEKSFIQYCLSKGIDTYIISWKNPDENDKTLTIGCYVEKGIKTALEKIKKKTHVLGFCLGGVGTTIAAATDGKKIIQSVTLLATPIDFSKLKEIQNYVKILDFKKYKKNILNQGYKKGRDLLRMFCMMRAENMIMDNIVNQYYLNRKPKPNDFLYWNMDATNLPAVMHVEYMEKFFMKNLLFKGQYYHNGDRVSLKNITVPQFLLATEKDHIVPPEGLFSIRKFDQEKTTYVLGGAGHVAGVINPPSAKKYGYKVLDQKGKVVKQADTSWWDEWAKWLTKKMGKRVQFVDEGGGKLYAAPGKYAKQQQGLKDYC